jgi:TPR repeat protein
VNEAVAWYRKAAAQGNVGAQFSLGSLSLKGIGVPRDPAKAIEWYRKAADQGYAPAQYNLGAMYDSGQGVEKNYAAAVGWYRKAARQGHTEAKRSLGLLASSKPGAATGMPLPLYAGQEEDTQQAAASLDTPLPGFRIQLASVKSDQPDTAQEMANRLNQDHGTVLDRLKVIPVRANLGDRGVYYRLRAGPIPEFAAAKRICRQLQERDQACIVLRAQQTN